MIIGNKNFEDNKKTYIMGIINTTPDSFYDGGRWNKTNEALKRVEQMLVDGADIIDIGGESTRPGYTRINTEEEVKRVIPLIDAVRHEFKDTVISVDTYKTDVAGAALYSGADMINDVMGLMSGSMAQIIAEYNAACCIMHNQENSKYDNLISDISERLIYGVNTAISAGIDNNRIMLDPGIGFGKEYEENMRVIAQFERFKDLGYPLLIGASRKSVIGLTLDLPVEERLEGTLAVTAYAVIKGCSFVRVHDIKENKRVINMIESIKKFTE